jgi:hypothetical protein
VTTLLQYRSAIGSYAHNDVMQVFGTPEFEISLSPVFGQWLQVAHGQNVGSPLSCGDVLVITRLLSDCTQRYSSCLKLLSTAAPLSLCPTRVPLGMGSHVMGLVEWDL